MRVIIFSWEYPPRVVGKLSDYVKALSTQLANKKVDVNVVTYDDSRNWFNARIKRSKNSSESQTLFELTLAF